LILINLYCLLTNFLFFFSKMGYQFTKEELAVLKQCNTESFFQRSMPIATFFGVGTWAAVQRGFLSGSAKFGAGPKVFAAVTVGYFIGKLSYQQKCAEKIMRLPNSQLAEMLKRKNKGEFFEKFTSDGGISLAPFGSSTEVYTDEILKPGQNNSLDLDFDRPANGGLDDTYRPSLDTPDRSFNDNLPLQPPSSSVSYGDLRKQNREEYEKKMQTPFNKPLPNDTPPVYRGAARDEPAYGNTGPKNQYGDVWQK